MKIKMLLRQLHLLYNSIINLLSEGELPAWIIEDELAREFNVTQEERAIPHPSGGSAWTNNVSHALKDLVNRRKIKRVAERKGPGGGKRGVYRIA